MTSDRVSNERTVEALDNLRVHQRQLDPQGIEVGVSREALNEVIRVFGQLSLQHLRSPVTVSDEMVERACKVFVPAWNRGQVTEGVKADVRVDMHAALTVALAPAEQEGESIAGAVLAWMVEHEWLDAGCEYYAADVIDALNSNAAPTHPGGDSRVVAPQFDGVAKRKLDDLLARGWEINGYAIKKDGDHGLVTTGAFVGWFSVAERNAKTAEASLAVAREDMDSRTAEFRDKVALSATEDEILRFRDGYPNPAGGSRILYRHTIEQARYRYADAIIAARAALAGSNGE